MQFDHEDWMKLTNRFKNEITDSVLETALRRLPAESYKLRHEVLLNELKQRREDMPRAMEFYYKFINKIADIKLSDKNEWVNIQGTTDGSMRVSVRKMNKSGEVKGELMDKTFEAGLTKEIRIYTGDGDDSVSIENKTSLIALRIIGRDGRKVYRIEDSKKRIKLYDKEGPVFYGDSNRFIKYISTDTANTTFVPVNLYNVTMPLLNIGINRDDGLLIGAGYVHTEQEGFRKYPFASQYQIMVNHSFSTSAFSASYKGEWTSVWGRADLTVQGFAYAPDNTQNFFGNGNETVINKTGDYKKYYRTRFNLYQVLPALRWNFNGHRNSISFGPAIQYYHFTPGDNEGRFILQPGSVTTYDSSSLGSDRAHAGIIFNFNQDLRNSKLIPNLGLLDIGSNGRMAGIKYIFKILWTIESECCIV